MHVTTLSGQGTVAIPDAIRAAHHWQPGLELIIVDTQEGVLLKPARPFAPTSLGEAAGCLRYQGPAKSLEEMDAAIAKGIQERMG